MTLDEIKAVAKAAAKEGVAEALEENRKAFHIDPKKHFRHHDALEVFMVWMSETRSIAWRTVVGVVVLAVLGLILLGAITHVNKGG